MPTLVFDIETAGRDFDSFDALTQEKLLSHKDPASPLSEEELKEKVLSELGLSPYTGNVVTISCLEIESGKAATYFLAPGESIDETNDRGQKFQSLSEEGILRKFWDIAAHCTEFVTYNGRGFDIPFLMLKSAMYGIRPSKNLMRGRYPYQMEAQAIHIDLYDQMTFYRSFMGKHMSLHMACQAFGITSPKEGEIEGSQVSQAFKDGRYREIAEYCMADVIATGELYKIWNQYVRF